MCGNGITEGAEECDDGGICIGGSNAGTPCTAESQCIGTGVCIGGEKAETVCTSNEDCPNGACRHCVPFGGGGCSANCTLETTILFTLDSASTATIHNEPFEDSPSALSGSEEIAIGSPVGGQATFVVKEAWVHLSKVDVNGRLCACFRGVAAKSCGGTVFEADGSQTMGCTPGYTVGDTACTDAGKNPCAFINGPGNASAGIISCNGLEGANVSQTQDSRGSADPPQCLDPSGVGGAICAAPAVLTLSGHGGPGSAVAFNTQAIGFALHACFSAPASFCTDSDPFTARGAPVTAPLVTNTATGEMFNINGQDGVNLGPFVSTGSPFSCDGTVSNVVLAGASTAPNQPLLGDVVVTTAFQAAVRAPLVPTSTPTASPTQTQTPTRTPGSGDCCECSGVPAICGPAVNGSCGACTPVFGARCDGNTGHCVFSSPPATPTVTLTPTPTNTPGSNDCCQCTGTPAFCGPVTDGTCGGCNVVFGAACAGESGQCVAFTATPSLTTTQTLTVTPSPTATSSVTGTSTRTATSTPSPSGTPPPSDTPPDTPTETPTETRTPTEPPTDTPSPTAVPCIGDCDHSGSVTIDDIVTMVNIALGAANVDTCAAGDPDHNGTIAVNEILSAVNNALTHCS